MEFHNSEFATTKLDAAIDSDGHRYGFNNQLSPIAFEKRCAK